MSGQGKGEFDEFKKDIDAAERRVAGEIEPGARALVVAILVFVLMFSFVIPNTGGARGFDALLGGPAAAQAAIALPHRVFAWFALVFGIGFSILALITRRWVFAWIALAGSAVGSVAGMLAVWTRQTTGVHHTTPPPGPGIGLIMAWIAMILLTFHWGRVVWSRTAVHLAAEEARRRAIADRQSQTLLDTLDDDPEH